MVGKRHPWALGSLRWPYYAHITKANFKPMRPKKVSNSLLNNALIATPREITDVIRSVVPLYLDRLN